MGDHLHQRLSLSATDVVEVTCDHQCNVMLLSDSDYSQYKRGDSFHYVGGNYNRFPVRLPAPHAGTWNVVLDFAGGTGTVRHSLRVIPG